MIHGTWSPVTVGSHSQDGQWSSATNAASGCTCHVQRSRSPTFQTSFTATSVETCGGRDTKKTPRDGEGRRDTENPPCFCCPLTLVFFDAYSQNSLKLSPGWQLNSDFVGFLLTITTILIYPSLFSLFCFSYLFGYCEELDRRQQWQWRIISLLLINSFVNWLYCCILCWWCAHSFSHLVSVIEGALWLVN